MSDDHEADFVEAEHIGNMHIVCAFCSHMSAVGIYGWTEDTDDDKTMEIKLKADTADMWSHFWVSHGG